MQCSSLFSEIQVVCFKQVLLQRNFDRGDYVLFMPLALAMNAMEICRFSVKRVTVGSNERTTDSNEKIEFNFLPIL